MFGKACAVGKGRAQASRSASDARHHRIWKGELHENRRTSHESQRQSRGSDDSIEQAAQAMLWLDAGLLPVCDNHTLLGVVTHKDIVRRGIAVGKDSRATRVSDIMSRDVLCCFEDQDVDEVLSEVGDKQIHHLAVVDREQHLVGMISLREMRGAKSESVQTMDGTKFPAGWRRAIEPVIANSPHKIGYYSDDDY